MPSPIYFYCLILIVSSCHHSNQKLEDLEVEHWHRNNLSVLTFQNGDSIEYIKNEKEWQDTNRPAYSYYDNDSSNINKFGLLYNWYAVADPRGICPKGWRVSTSEDWNELINRHGGSEVSASYLKSKKYWTISGDSIVANSGFEALPGGNRREDGKFNGVLLSATFWTIDEVDEKNAVAFYMNYAHNRVGSNEGDKKNGLSCRCVKEQDDE